jgi:hypothetical protein
MPSWPWTAKSRHSVVSSPSPTPTMKVSPPSPASPTGSWFAAEDEDEEDDDVVNAVIKGTNEHALREAAAQARRTTNPPPRLKSASRNRHLRRPVPSFDQFANSIPEEATPDFHGSQRTQPISETETMFPENPEEFLPIEEADNVAPAIPARSTSRASQRDMDVELDLPVMSEPIGSNSVQARKTQQPAASPEETAQTADSEVVRLRKVDTCTRSCCISIIY